jgi:hypothetical protein
VGCRHSDTHTHTHTYTHTGGPLSVDETLLEVLLGVAVNLTVSSEEGKRALLSSSTRKGREAAADTLMHHAIKVS